MKDTRRGRRRSLARRGAGALVVALAVTTLVGSAPKGVTAAVAAPVPSVPGQLGFYPGYANLTQLKALESWVGRDATYVVQFADQSTANFTGSVWGEVTKAGALQTIANQVSLVESIPLAFGGNINASTAAGQATARAALQATVNGTNDANYKVAAKYMVAGGYGDAIIRLGWEFDGDWYPWSARGNEALWVTAYRHVVDLFRTISPNFRFDWNGDPGALQKATAAYPGDAYVDIIGLDVYDKGIPVAWNSTTKSWADPVAALNWDLTSMRFQRDFAISHGKQVSYPEWALSGVTATVTSNVGGDNPTFIQGMNDFIASLPASGPGSLAYQSYFNEDAPDGHHRINTTFFPSAQQRYLSVFGAATDITVSSNAAPSVYKQPVVLTATISNDQLPASAFGGTLRFYNGTTAIGTAASTVTNGVASATTTALGVGDRTITARYTPAAGVTPLQSSPFVQHVNPAPTTTSATSTSPTSVVFGQQFTLVAVVKPVAPSSGTPGGSVSFTNLATNTTVTRTLVYGRATLLTSSLALGPNTFSVQYVGSKNYARSNTSFTRTVVKASSTTTFVWAPHGAIAGTPVSFTATVKCTSPCPVVPTGTVTFADGATAISGAISVNSNGVATFVTSSLAKATHSITANYSGNGGILSSSKTLSVPIS